MRERMGKRGIYIKRENLNLFLLYNVYKLGMMALSFGCLKNQKKKQKNYNIIM